MEIDKKLHNEIKEYCKLNGLKMTDFINHLLKKAFNIEKYGLSPFAPKYEQFVPQVKEEKTNVEEPIVEEPKVEDKPQVIHENIDDTEYKVVELKPKKRKLSRKNE